ncbi:MAG TPA: rhamnose ABC transporter substrate-binding protein [Pseudolysinimonas sp.]|jgi:rhamnose transport system substrate-binding protein|nr:rhamnose ABC transporter substrate-binding protein [Pseudolysinimonas sp.]
MRSTQFRVLAGVAVIGMLSLAGCAAGGGGGNSAADENGCIDGPITVGLIPKLGDDPYMTTHRDGVQKAADEIGDGDKVVYTSPSEATGAAQIPFVQQLISQKVDVIAISGSDLDGAKAELQKAREAGIKVLAYDSDVAPDARSLFINQADTAELGTAMLDSMSEMLGGEGDFAILSSTQTAVNQNAWIDDMKKRLASDPAFAKLNLVDVAYGEEKADVSANRAKELVAKYPNLKGIIVPAGISLPAAATALDESGDLGRVKLTGLAPVSLIRDYIKGGDVQDIWWNVTDLGYLTMYAAKALASCETDGTPGDTFDAGELGSYTVGDNGVVILGPSVVATPENADDFAF